MSDELDLEEGVDDFDYADALSPSACPACYAGVHSDCYNPGESETGCCCSELLSSVGADGQSEVARQEAVIAKIKEASEITDVQSTGRKRAALAYPITEGMICEWARLAKAGGGVKPIIGCLGNAATDRHHGPDKNTLNNTEGNVHRICATCHVRWHAANDEFYGARPAGTEPFIPLDGYPWSGHDPETKATDEEIANNEIYWATRKPKKVRD